MRVLICTQPIIGHVAPGLVLADALRTAGHEVAWYTGTCVRAHIEARGYKVYPIVRAFDYDGENPNAMFPKREGLTGIADIKFILKNVFAAAMPLQAQDLDDILRRFPADVLLADFVTFGPRVISERGGAPWAAYGFSALPLSSRDTAPYGLGLAPSATRLGRVRNHLLNGLFKHALMRDVVQHHDAMRARCGLPAVALGPTDTPLSPYLFLQGSIEALEYPRSDLAPQVHFVGPLTPPAMPPMTPPAALPHAREPHAEGARPAWWPALVARRRPVVLVTQGTMDNRDLGELMRPALAALASEDCMVIATTGRELSPGELGDIPANAHVERFVPYHDLLPHVDVMVSNGGYNGVLIALSNGVPMVVCGAQSDKPEICARVQWSGAGVRLGRQSPKPEQIRTAVRTLLGDGRFKARAQAFQGPLGAATAGPTSVRLLEQLARTRSPVLREGLIQPPQTMNPKSSG